ncbi:MAG: hypothetical protein MUE44_27250 [Oscillatoriaceae cyanobacterium Prado104]|nr:hypothetical protein [Oscillatoriaceae cyanobacterium Prado104]
MDSELVAPLLQLTTAESKSPKIPKIANSCQDLRFIKFIENQRRKKEEGRRHKQQDF